MITIYHNNRCSKSIECLNLIKQSNVSFDVVEYLKVNFNITTIEKIVYGINENLKDIVRVNEKEIKGIDINFNNKKQIINLIFKFKVCMQRPIVFDGKKYLLCRPPVKVLELMKGN